MSIKTARTGFTESRRILDLCVGQNVPVIVGSQYEGAIGVTATIAFAAAFAATAGQPAEIANFLDLAEDLIRLAGLTPGHDIAIEITGLKQGEKLYEELMTAEEGATMTHHERIYVAPPSYVSPELLNPLCDALIDAAQRGDTREVVDRLQRMDVLFTEEARPLWAAAALEFAA